MHGWLGTCNGWWYGHYVDDGILGQRYYADVARLVDCGHGAWTMVILRLLLVSDSGIYVQICSRTGPYQLLRLVVLSEVSIRGVVPKGTPSFGGRAWRW